MAWVEVVVLATEDTPNRREIQEVLGYVARKAKPRFYADENFPAQAVALLRWMGARVATTKEANQSGHPDENHAAYALRKGLVLITCDRDFLDDKRFPLIHCPAIFVFDFGRGTVQDMRAAFRCLAPLFDAPQMFDKWCKVDAGTDSWTELLRFQNGRTSRTRLRFGRRGIEEWVDD
jgi:predicted nuclease of predicted toxin-antitoxin system